MSRRVIVVGDAIDHGGEVVSGSPSDAIDGRAIAREGDEVRCRRHGRTHIAEGCTTARIDGRAIALEGHRTACGARLIGSSGARIE
ncbi:MAG: PAAR domain-containing protein [Betaproteobacteria bacterium]|nr:PAAR domain-containing protein [Betaproteobacteria bacterium]